MIEGSLGETLEPSGIRIIRIRALMMESEGSNVYGEIIKWKLKAMVGSKGFLMRGDILINP